MASDGTSDRGAAARPGCDPGMTFERSPHRVTVTFNGRIIADTRRAVMLRAPGSAPVPYIPREDVDMTLLERTSHATYCPYKGDAKYYRIRTCGRSSENAVWTYEVPYPVAAPIAGHLAFYPDRVDAIEERPIER
jgi:uncharacterized protein (DUF427 family)